MPVFAEQSPQLPQRIQAAAYRQQADQRGAPARRAISRGGNQAEEAVYAEQLEPWSIKRQQQHGLCKKQGDAREDECVNDLGVSL
ncbi:hypothetical protein D3C85_1381600 [compost metagenome]